ncbi:MAG: hypothetical protein ACU0A4_03460 [Paracoccaceae bacterium]
MANLSKSVLIEKALEVVVGYQFAINTWSPCLSDERIIRPEYLKDCAFVIFVGCLRDLVESSDRSNKAKRVFDSLKGFDDAFFQHNIREIFALNMFAADFLCRMSHDEQIFLTYARNRTVHGYLNGRSEPKNNYYVINKPTGTQSPFEVKSVTREVQQKIAQSVAAEGIMQGIKKIREKYMAQTLILIDTLKLITDLPPVEIKRALTMNYILVNSDIKTQYLDFKNMLDDLSA